MKQSNFVTLNPNDFSVACHVAQQRCVNSLRDRRTDRLFKKTWDEDLRTHVVGACGELAFSKWLGVYPGYGVEQFAGMEADVKKKYEIRTRTKEHYELIVHTNDPEDRIYVLVRGLPPKFHVVGWIAGSSARRKDFLQDHGGYRPSYFVPDSFLHPMETLPK